MSQTDVVVMFQCTARRECNGSAANALLEMLQVLLQLCRDQLAASPSIVDIASTVTSYCRVYNTHICIHIYRLEPCVNRVCCPYQCMSKEAYWIARQ
jgi:hypothetical protein